MHSEPPVVERLHVHALLRLVVRLLRAAHRLDEDLGALDDHQVTHSLIINTNWEHDSATICTVSASKDDYL